MFMDRFWALVIMVLYTSRAVEEIESLPDSSDSPYKWMCRNLRLKFHRSPTPLANAVLVHKIIFFIGRTFYSQQDLIRFDSNRCTRSSPFPVEVDKKAWISQSGHLFTCTTPWVMWLHELAHVVAWISILKNVISMWLHGMTSMRIHRYPDCNSNWLFRSGKGSGTLLVMLYKDNTKILGHLNLSANILNFTWL